MIKQAGQRFSFPARLYNDVVALVKAWKSGDLDKPSINRRSGHTLRIRNDSGGDLSQFGVLGIDGVVFNESDNSNEFKANTTLKGSTPVIATHAGNFAVLLEPCKDGKFARCVISGHCVVQVDMIDADDNWCDVKASSANLSSYGAGSAQIIHKPTGTGVKWCLVNLAQSYGPATRYRGQQVGALLVSDANNVVDNLIALDGVPVETSVTADNVLNWSSDDNAPTYIEYNAASEVWEMYNVECPA